MGQFFKQIDFANRSDSYTFKDKKDLIFKSFNSNIVVLPNVFSKKQWAILYNFFVEQTNESFWIKHLTKRQTELIYKEYGVIRLEDIDDKENWQEKILKPNNTMGLDLFSSIWKLFEDLIIKKTNEKDNRKTSFKTIKDLSLYFNNSTDNSSEFICSNIQNEWYFLYFIKTNCSEKDFLYFIDSNLIIPLEPNMLILIPNTYGNDYIIHTDYEPNESIDYIKGVVSN